MTAQPTPDGALQPAIHQLHNAISALIDPKRVTLDTGKHTWLDPLLLQLYDAIAGQNVTAKSGGPARSPMWCGAFAVAHKIDHTIAQWVPEVQPTPGGYPPTTQRLQHLANKKWRPQDTTDVHAKANQLEEFILEIETLLNPEPIAYLRAPGKSRQPAACTACGTRRVWKPDPNEPNRRIMQPALKITTHGCVCQACRASWQPGELRILAAAIGYPLPAGLLE